MDNLRKGDATRLLQAWAEGDQDAFNELISLVYRDVHRVARNMLRGEAPATRLQTTELVNEIVCRLVKNPEKNLQNRSHFFAIIARKMRRILVDEARKRKAGKRNAGRTLVPLDDHLQIKDSADAEASADILALHEALRRLTEMDARQGQVMELKFFGGLEINDIAEVIGVSPATIKRDSRSALAWLRRELSIV